MINFMLNECNRQHLTQDDINLFTKTSDHKLPNIKRTLFIPQAKKILHYTNSHSIIISSNSQKEAQVLHVSFTSQNMMLNTIKIAVLIIKCNSAQQEKKKYHQHILEFW